MPSPAIRKCVPVSPVSREEYIRWFEEVWPANIGHLFDRLKLYGLQKFPCLGKREARGDFYCWRGSGIDDDFNSSIRPGVWINGEGGYRDPLPNIYGLFGPSPYLDGTCSIEWWPDDNFTFLGLTSEKKWLRVSVRSERREDFPDRQWALEVHIDQITAAEFVDSQAPIYSAYELLERLSSIISDRQNVLDEANRVLRDLRAGLRIYARRMQGIDGVEQEFHLPAGCYAPDRRVVPIGRDEQGLLQVRAWLEPNEYICPQCVRIYSGQFCPQCAARLESN